MEEGASPKSKLTDKISNFKSRVFGRFNFGEDVTEEEIISMVNEGHEQGVLQASEVEMIHNIFELDDKEAKDIMIHRKNIIAIGSDTNLSEAMDYMLDNIYSRFPVYKDDMDNIIGVVHIKDAMIQSRNQSNLELPISQLPGLVRNIPFIPETRKIHNLFKSMQSQKNHMAIVVDEYGQTAGLVTMEDILEEIVGNILDEYDVEDQMITPQADGSFLMKGMTPLEEVSEVLNLNCTSEEYDTLNGYLISLIDKIPKDGEVFQVEEKGYLFEILSVKNKIIQTVRVTQIEEVAEENDFTCQREKIVVE